MYLYLIQWERLGDFVMIESYVVVKFEWPDFTTLHTNGRDATTATVGLVTNCDAAELLEVI